MIEQFALIFGAPAPFLILLYLLYEVRELKQAVKDLDSDVSESHTDVVRIETILEERTRMREDMVRGFEQATAFRQSGED